MAKSSPLAICFLSEKFVFLSEEFVLLSSGITKNIIAMEKSMASIGE